MSPAPTSSVENVAQVLQPTSTVPLNEKISTLQTFSTTLIGQLFSGIRIFFCLSKKAK
jgi:hypothetical protein